MTLAIQILRPDGIAFEGDCSKLVGHCDLGSFCLLPNHVDWVTSLKPGILTLTLTDQREVFFAVDHGVLVKQDRRVNVSTLYAIKGDLGSLRDAVEQQQLSQTEQEQAARLALERLEASLVRQILEWDGGNRG